MAADAMGLYEGCSVGELVVAAIGRGGDRVAFMGDDTRWTYRELAARISQVVQALQARGLRRGDALAALPVTGLGKLDKKAIRAKFRQGQQRAVH